MQQQDIARIIAAKVRSGRKLKGLSRKRLAAAAGVSERYLTALENAAANASIGIIARLANALGVEFASLMPGLDGDRTPASGPQGISSGPLTNLLGRMSPAEQTAAVAELENWLKSRRKPQKGLALLGLRGAGKTTLGNRFAEQHDLPFISITREIEMRAGLSLGDLFNLGGQEAYRALENEVVGELARRGDPLVLETAGGIAGNAEALALVLGSFRCVWVRASPEEHLNRVARQGDMRPMRGNPKALEHLKALLSAREAHYARAEYVLDTTGRCIEDCLAELERIAASVAK